MFINTPKFLPSIKSWHRNISALAPGDLAEGAVGGGLADEPGAVGVSPDGDVAFAVTVVVVRDGCVGSEIAGRGDNVSLSVGASADYPACSASDGEVGLAVTVVIAANGLRAGLREYDCLDIAVAAVDGVEGFVRAAPDGDVRPTVAIKIG
jgi:hypothetical protein